MFGSCSAEVYPPCTTIFSIVDPSPSTRSTYNSCDCGRDAREEKGSHSDGCEGASAVSEGKGSRGAHLLMRRMWLCEGRGGAMALERLGWELGLENKVWYIYSWLWYRILGKLSGHAVSPGVPRDQPMHGSIHHAMLCSCQAKMLCFGPGHRDVGCMPIYIKVKEQRKTISCVLLAAVMLLHCSFVRPCLDCRWKFFRCHIGCVGRMLGEVFRN